MPKLVNANLSEFIVQLFFFLFIIKLTLVLTFYKLSGVKMIFNLKNFIFFFFHILFISFLFLSYGKQELLYMKKITGKSLPISMMIGRACIASVSNSEMELQVIDLKIFMN